MNTLPFLPVAILCGFVLVYLIVKFIFHYLIVLLKVVARPCAGLVLVVKIDDVDGVVCGQRKVAFDDRLCKFLSEVFIAVTFFACKVAVGLSAVIDKQTVNAALGFHSKLNSHFVFLIALLILALLPVIILYPNFISK